MSRPAFSLSDAEARLLLQEVAPLLERHPLDPRDHGPFVRGFLRAVHRATGKTYGAEIYRRLLRTYAPGRSPSTSTLARERQLLDEELAVPNSPQDLTFDASVDAGTPFQPGIVGTLRRVLDDYLPAFSQLNTTTQRDAHVDFLMARLAEAERDRTLARSQAAHLAAQVQEQAAVNQVLTQQLAAAQAALVTQQQLASRLAGEMEGQRQFSLQAIDGVRGETRFAKERCAQLEAVLKDKEQMIDTLRMRVLGGALTK